uniref:CSON003806 protein n=1 Tax=Culicoides sonorensis TaxID=179676 RepID=A0A336L6I9_CULSO
MDTELICIFLVILSFYLRITYKILPITGDHIPNSKFDWIRVVTHLNILSPHLKALTFNVLLLIGICKQNIQAIKLYSVWAVISCALNLVIQFTIVMTFHRIDDFFLEFMLIGYDVICWFYSYYVLKTWKIEHFKLMEDENEKKKVNG